MSFTYTDYHYHQFDRQFLLPLPMPSPTSCWYPQRQDVQFGYSYLDPACPIPALPFSTPRPSLVSDPLPEADPPDGTPLYTAAQPPYQSFQPSSPPYQPPYNGVDHMEPLGMPRDPVTQDLKQNISVAALVSQLERLTADVEQLVSRMDANQRLLGDPQGQSSGLSPNTPQQPSPAPLFALPTYATLEPPLYAGSDTDGPSHNARPERHPWQPEHHLSSHALFKTSSEDSLECNQKESLILDFEQVEEDFADSTMRIRDSSTGFGGIEKVEKTEGEVQSRLRAQRKTGSRSRKD